MKTPRIGDFDPDVKVPTLKSSLDNLPVIQKPTHTPLSEKKIVPKERSNQLTYERANARTPVRPSGKRIITRNSFEIYEDQMNSLRKLSLEEKMDGKLGSMSSMVRDALDFYLKGKAPKR
jgi:hypothetical protein